MRKNYYSRKSRHIVRIGTLAAATILSCASTMAEDASSKKKIAIPAADNTTFVYNGNIQEYGIPADTLYSVYGSTHKAAGSHKVKVTLNDPSKYEWEDGSIDSKIYDFVIKKVQIEIPAADTTHFLYTGSQHKYNIPENDKYTIDGYRKTNAGNHKVYVILNDTVNYEWTDKTIADKIYKFNIGKVQVDSPAADTSKFTYDGTLKVYNIIPSIHYSVLGNMQTNAGDYKVKVALADSANYAWGSGSSEALIYNFNISKAEIALPTAVKDTFDFDGNIKSFNVVSNDYYTVDVTNEMATSVGTYKRTVSINDTKNYKWADGTSESKTVTFVIKEGTVKIPEIIDFKYTGATNQFVPLNEAYMVKNGEAVNAGEYDVTLTLKHGYVWEDGTNEAKVLKYKILPIYVNKPNVSNSVVTYDGNPYSINVPADSAYSVAGVAAGMEPGKYTTTISLNPNYCWNDDTTTDQTYTLIINKIKLAIPAADTTTIYYNQKEQTYQIEENANYTITGNKHVEVGNYKVVVTLNDTVHYEWADASVKAKYYNFDIKELESFDFEISEFDANATTDDNYTINLDIKGFVQYYKLSCDELPALKDTLVDFDNETSAIHVPMPSDAAPGKYNINVTLYAGKIDTTFTVEMAVNYPASSIIVCWNDVIAVDDSKVNTTTYQWYKDGVLIPGATEQYYVDKNGLSGQYKCAVDGGIFVGPAYMNFGQPLHLSAYGDKGRIVASVVGRTTANIMLMSVGGMLTESKPAAKEVIFTVKPGIYVLTLDGTDQSVKVIVK